MPIDIACPVCETEFEAEIWENGECKCGNKYAWEEECAEDYSECWETLYWEKYKDSKGGIIKNNSF